MKKIVTIVSFIFICSFVDAQQIGMYSHYFYKPMVYNPAFTGEGDATNAMLISRSQWTGFKDNPKLNLFTLDGNLIAKKIGLGLTLISDNKGISTRTGGYLSYSYKLKINNDMHLLFGVSLGIIDQTINFSNVVVENINDQMLFTDAQQKTTFDGNAGVALIWKDLEFGAAVPQLFGNKINYVDNIGVREYYSQVRHYMASLKYHSFIAKEKGISIAPEGLVRFLPNTPVQFDGTVNLDWNGKFWIGATYKSGYAVAANVGFRVYKQFYVGYSYDFIIGNIGKYAGISHEIMINYKFGKSKKPEASVDTVSKPITSVMKPPVNKKNEIVEEAASDKESRIAAEKANGEKLYNLQTQVNESENKIKELKGKIQKASVQDTIPATPVLQPLNSLLIQQLQKKIEALLDNPNSTPAEIQEVRNDIASFLDTDIPDTTASAKLKKNYETLNQAPPEEAPSVMVKGNIIFDESELPNNYSAVSITITDKENSKIIGVYTPNSKTGKYLFILNPGKKYLITVKIKGYKTYSEDFAPENKKESYEMTQEIRLKKE